MSGNPILLFLVFWPMAGAFMSYFIGRKNKRLRDYCANAITIIEFLVMLSLLRFVNNAAPVTFQWAGFGHDRILFSLDGFRYIYGSITALMWMCTTIFSREYFSHYHNRNRYYFFMLLTLGATMGVFLSGDLLTTFIFFEIMSFTSYVMVIHDEKPGAQLASKTYMAVAVLGGLVMLMGLFILHNTIGTLEIALIRDAAAAVEDKTPLFWAGGLMLVGFGGKAGMYPLHVWLPNAHPVAPAPASALLSGVLTKTGVFGILVISTQIFFGNKAWGMALLVIGVITMFTGAFLAVFSIDLKRTLACSSMSQIGFILVGTAMQCILLAKDSTIHYHFMAVFGSLLHMMNHSLIKLVLFMAAGVVYMNLHKLDLNEIRGFGYRKPLLKLIFGMGVLAIIGMPLWSGYISKTLIHESIVEQIWYILDYTAEARFFQVVESIFTLTGGLTAAYMIKIYIAVFFEKNPYNQEKMDASNKKYMSPVNAVMLTACSLILPFLGMQPALMDKIASFGKYFMNGHDPEKGVEYFAWMNLRGAVASLAIGLIVYLVIVRGCLMQRDENNQLVYVNVWPRRINIETYIYRPLLLRVLPFIGAFFARAIGSIVETVGKLGYRAFMWCKENVHLPWELRAGNIERFKEAAEQHSLIERPGVVAWARELLGIETEDEEAQLTCVTTLAGEQHELISPLTSVPGLDYLVGQMTAAESARAQTKSDQKKNGETNLPQLFREAVKGSMAYSLVLFSIGLVISLLYILFR